MCRGRSSDPIGVGRAPCSLAKGLPRLVTGLSRDLVAQRPRERPSMAPGDDIDDDPPVFDPLDRLVPSVDRQLLANRLRDGDLAAFSDSTAHGMDDGIDSYSDCRVCPQPM